jgi:hypothetical protein
MTKRNRGRKLLGNDLARTVSAAGLATALMNSGKRAISRKATDQAYVVAETLGQMGADKIYDVISNSIPTWREQKGSGTFRKSNSKSVVPVGRPLSIPTGFGATIQSQPYTFGSAQRHPIHGPGLRIRGNELTCYGALTPGSHNFFGVTTPAADSFTAFPLNPLSVGAGAYLMPRLATFASNFDLFVFREFTVTYVPNTGTDRTGSFALGYCRDGAETATAVPDPAAIMQLSPSLMSPFYMGTSVRVPCGTNRTDEAFYTQIGALGGDSEKRLSWQGKVFCQHNSAPLPDVQLIVGTFIISYVCDLYSPCKSNVVLP